MCSLLLFSCKSVRCALPRQMPDACASVCVRVCASYVYVCMFVCVFYVYGWSAALHHSQTLSPLWVVVVLIVGGQSRCYAARQLLSSASR